MNSNSFKIKGMSVTITSALLALSANDFNLLYISIVYFSLFVFWGLDAYYLSQEKGYRALYDKVRSKEGKTDFSLKLDPSNIKGENSWNKTLLNKTILPLYLIQGLIALALILFFKYKLSQ